jgi:hypothetical protein
MAKPNQTNQLLTAIELVVVWHWKGYSAPCWVSTHLGEANLLIGGVTYQADTTRQALALPVPVG